MSVAPGTAQITGADAVLQGSVATIDTLIITLINLRRELNAEMARSCLRSGRVRTNLAWEKKVIDSYREGVGQQGVRMALLLLGMSQIDGLG
jgi:chorismate mutase